MCRLRQQIWLRHFNKAGIVAAIYAPLVVEIHNQSVTIVFENNAMLKSF